MKMLRSDPKKGEMKVKAQNPDDVLTLNSIIGQGDIVSGFCERKIKVGKGENVKPVKKRYFLRILVEKTEFNGKELRLNGKTLDEKEEIPKGSYQAIEVVPGSEIKIEKEKWSAYHLKKIKDATFESKQKILIVVFDRENAIFAKTKKNGFDVLLEMQGDVQKKAYETKKESKFFQELINKIREYVTRFNITSVIIASPAFWKEDLLKLVKDKNLKEKVIATSCGSVSENAIYEVLKSSALKKVMEEERAVKEMELVEKVIKEIARGGAVAYGLEEASNYVEMGNIKTLLFTDDFFYEKQQSGESEYIEGLISKAEKRGADINIISSDHEGGQKLDGLGGIAALLRYKSHS